MKPCAVDWALQLQMLGYGLLAGVLGGVLGIGGGVVYVVVLPAALVAMGVQANEVVAFTVANSLFSTVFTTLSGNIKLFLDRNFHSRIILYISITGIITSIVLLYFFVNTPYYSKQLFNTIFLGMIGFMMVRLVLKSIQQSNGEALTYIPKDGTGALISTGLLAGAVSPLTGLGGGVVIVPVLHSFLQFPIKQANAISLGVIGITSIASSIFNMTEHPASQVHDLQLGYIIFPVVAALSIGGMIGSVVGINISKKLKPQWITLLFAAFLLLILLKKLFDMFG